MQKENTKMGTCQSSMGFFVYKLLAPPRKLLGLVSCQSSMGLSLYKLLASPRTFWGFDIQV